MSEFKEYVLSKPLKTVVKLNYLKSCLVGEAYDLIKHYTHGNQLRFFNVFILIFLF